jgi:choline dehydrogenase-like flavoprotein
MPLSSAAVRAAIINGATDVYRSWYQAAHPGGTAKIGEIVDSNLKTEIDKLYVCDCSVVPEEWGLLPSLTLLALGKRLARHLMKPAELTGRGAEMGKLSAAVMTFPTYRLVNGVTCRDNKLLE